MYKHTLKKLFFAVALGTSLTAFQFGTAQADDKTGGKPGIHKPGEHKPGEWGGRGGGPGRGRGRGMMMERWSKELGLTEKQKASMRKVMDESRAKSEKIRNDKNLSDSQKREKMKAHHENTRKRMNAILTPAQRKKAEKMRADWRKNHKGGPGGFGGPGGGPGGPGGRGDWGHKPGGGGKKPA